MSTNSSERNTYPIDTESPAEMAQLINLDRITTKVMGGPFTGIADPSSLRTVLDLACGPGGWVLDAAFELPQAQVASQSMSKQPGVFLVRWMTSRLARCWPRSRRNETRPCFC